MPAPVYKGSFPVKTREETRYLDKGKVEYSVTNVYQSANMVTGTIGSTLSYAGKTLALTNISVNKKNGLAEVTRTYTGGDSSAPDVYEVVASLSEEPIASHPAFTAPTGIFASSIVAAAGGSVTEGEGGIGGVVFDASGGFVKFTNQATNKFLGVQSFLSPLVSYRRIYSAGQAPSSSLTSKVGTIYSTPAGSPPAVPSGRNWILSSLTWKNNGNQLASVGQYEITEEYKSSGPKGWNNGIYYTTN
jgi:hypothetical protein